MINGHLQRPKLLIPRDFIDLGYDAYFREQALAAKSAMNRTQTGRPLQTALTAAIKK